MPTMQTPNAGGHRLTGAHRSLPAAAPLPRRCIRGPVHLIIRVRSCRSRAEREYKSRIQHTNTGGTGSRPQCDRCRRAAPAPCRDLYLNKSGPLWWNLVLTHYALTQFPSECTSLVDKGKIISLRRNM